MTRRPLTIDEKAILAAAQLEGRLKPGRVHGRCRSKWLVFVRRSARLNDAAWWYTETDYTALRSLTTGTLVTYREYDYAATDSINRPHWKYCKTVR